jgi:hypothetical protein
MNRHVVLCQIVLLGNFALAQNPPAQPARRSVSSNAQGPSLDDAPKGGFCDVLPAGVEFTTKRIPPTANPKLCESCVGFATGIRIDITHFKTAEDLPQSFKDTPKDAPPPNLPFGDRAWFSAPYGEATSLRTLSLIRGLYVITATGSGAYALRFPEFAKLMDEALKRRSPACPASKETPATPPEAAELTEPPAWLKELNPAPYGFSWTKGTRIRAYSITVSTAKRNMRSGWITGNSIPPVDMPPGGTVTVTLTSRPETGADITKTCSFRVLAEASLSDR